MPLSHKLRRVAFGLVAVIALANHARGQIENPSFEDVTLGVPDAWTIPPACRDDGWEVESVRTAIDGEWAARIHRDGVEAAPQVIGNLMQGVPAEPFRGKRVRFEGRVNFMGNGGSQLQMWVRADRPDGQPGFFDNMRDRPVRGPEWKNVVIEGNIDEDAERVAFGFFISGGAGHALIDDIRVTILGDALEPGFGSKPPAPLTPRGAANVSATIRLIGVLRYFHPADEVVSLDWTAFAIAALDTTEASGSPEALAVALRELVAPIAPTVQVWAGTVADAPARPALDPSDARWVVGIRHDGLGKDLTGTHDSGRGYRNIYASKLIREKLPTDGEKSRGVLPSPPYDSVIELGGGVCARVPHVLLASEAGTLPRPDGESAAMPDRPDGWTQSPDDRTFRLAVVGEAWAIWEHFYPYWDVVDADWDVVLEESVRAAATAEDSSELGLVLARLVASAHDGHGNLFSQAFPPAIPVAAEWVEGKLVCLKADLGVDIQPGDAIVAIDGRPVAEILTEASSTISASTDGWLRFKAVQGVLQYAASDGPTCEVTIERPDGTQMGVTVARMPAGAWRGLRPNTPQLAEEVAPGIRYVDLNGLSWDRLAPHMNELIQADGIIFDLRGYPDSAGKQILHHLTDELIYSAYWRVPRMMKPEFADVEYQESRWSVMPLEPRLDAEIVFITDGSAISYAESCMAIVEAYELGEIVGSRTAGTNGNINQVMLPGGYGMIWTGMRVVKHDGETPHQGVGVEPTIPCERTIAGVAAGRDELIERAIEVIQSALD